MSVIFSLAAVKDNEPVDLLGALVAECKELQIKCQVKDHPQILNAMIFVSSVLGDLDKSSTEYRFYRKILFRKTVDLLHDTTKDCVSDWFDNFCDYEDDDLIEILEPIRDDIDCNVYVTPNEMKLDLEKITGLSRHSNPNAIFDVAVSATLANGLDVMAQFTCLQQSILHSIATNYLHVACTFVPREIV